MTHGGPPTMLSRIAILMIAVIALSLPLGACGKKGPPEKPDPTYPHEYPRQ